MSEKWYELPVERWRMPGSNPHRFWERDSQREKIYLAEATAKYRMKKELGLNLKPFTSIDQVREYTKKLINSAWFKRRWGKRVVYIKQARGLYSYAKLNTICLTSNQVGDILVLLHELAHAVRINCLLAPHGRHFARSFLELVKHELGQEAGKLLRASYKEYKVKYIPKRHLTEEEREARRERFMNLIKRGVKC